MQDFCCNGTVVQDPELGQVIQLQGDQRKNVSQFLVQVSEGGEVKLCFNISRIVPGRLCLLCGFCSPVLTDSVGCLIRLEL